MLLTVCPTAGVPGRLVSDFEGCCHHHQSSPVSHAAGHARKLSCGQESENIRVSHFTSPFYDLF